MNLSLDQSSKVVSLLGGMIAIGTFLSGVLGAVLPEGGFGFAWLAGVTGWFSDHASYLFGASALVSLSFYFAIRRRITPLEDENQALRTEVGDLSKKIPVPPSPLYPDWDPPQKHKANWASCDVLRLPVDNLTKPYVVTFQMMPQMNSDWHGGLIFFEDGKRDIPRIIFHASRDVDPWEREQFSALGYWDKSGIITVREAQDELQPPKEDQRITPGTLTVRIARLKNCLFLTMENLAWRLTGDQVPLDRIGAPHLAHWWEKGFSQVFFRDIQVHTPSPDEILLLEHLGTTTARSKHTVRTNKEVLDALEKLKHLPLYLERTGEFPTDYPFPFIQLRNYLTANHMQFPDFQVQENLPLIKTEPADRAIHLALLMRILHVDTSSANDAHNVILRFHKVEG